MNNIGLNNDISVFILYIQHFLACLYLILVRIHSKLPILSNNGILYHEVFFLIEHSASKFCNAILLFEVSYS